MCSRLRIRQVAAAALAALVCSLGLTPTASRALAHPASRRLTRIYIVNRCGESEAIAPGELLLSCSGAATNLPFAAGLTDRHYGSAVVVAAGVVDVCLISPPGQPLGPPSGWRRCPEADLSPAERSEAERHAFPAHFRFTDVVRCRGRKGLDRYRSRLFYGRLSYTFAGKAWTRESNLPAEFSNGEKAERERCHPIG